MRAERRCAANEAVAAAWWNVLAARDRVGRTTTPHLQLRNSTTSSGARGGRHDPASNGDDGDDH
jgi:hypothetical protein